MKHIAITACPFSGARHTKQLLCKLGLDVGHEKMGNDGIVSWPHAHYTRDDFIAIGFANNMVKLHQIRHPLMAISQILGIHNGSQHPAMQFRMDHGGKMYIRKKMNEQTIAMGGPDLSKIHKLEWAMDIWYYWSRFGIESSDGWYTIESLPNRWEWFSKLIDYPGADMPKVSKTNNRHNTRRIYSWDDLVKADCDLAFNIANLAIWMGYDIIPERYIDDPFYDFPNTFISPEIELAFTCVIQ